MDAEQKALDFASKLKAGMGKDSTAAAEVRAVARSNKVSFDNLNEDSDCYSLTPWNPDDPTFDLHISNHTCLSVRQGPCIDSGSQVDISNDP